MWQRTKSFQGLRLLFFISIVAGHCGQTICGGGGELCSFFFIISGFLFSDKYSWREYVCRKARNIFPIYFICLLMLVLGRYYQGHGHLSWDIVPHLLLIQSWIPQINSCPSYYLGPAWFLSSLWFCYLLSHVLYKFFNKQSLYVLCLIAVINVSIIFVNHFVNWSEYSVWCTYISPIERLLEYTIGMLLGLIIRNKAERVEPFVGCGMLIVILYLLLIKYTGLDWLFIYIHPFILAFIYLFHSSSVDNLLGNRIVLRLASSGMCIYLSHNVIKMAIPGNWLFKTIVCVVLGIAFNEVYLLILKYLKRNFKNS